MIDAELTLAWKTKQSYADCSVSLEEHDNKIRADERARVIAMVKNRLGCYDHECEDCYFKNGNACKFDDLWDKLK